MAIDVGALQRLVGPALAFDRALARGGCARADGGRGLARGRIEQLLRRHRGHFDVQVDAIQERAAELALVARHLCWVLVPAQS